MRVAYLTNQYPKVSHTFIRREILALEHQGVEVSRFSLRGWDAEVTNPQDQSEKKKTRYTLSGGVLPLLLCLSKCAARFPRQFRTAFKTAILMSRNSVRSWPYHLIYLAHACRIRLWLEENPVSHIHAHFGTNPAEVAMLVHFLGGGEYSFTIHGMDEADDVKRLGFDHKIAHAKFVVAISAYTRSQLMRHVAPKHWPKIKVVHCGLPPEAFENLTHDVPTSSTRLLCIGRLSPEKGHLILLEAFVRLLHDHEDIQLVLAGDGPMRDEIEDRIRALGIAKSVRITGWISSAEVKEEIAACHTLVQPSFIEGLPVVIMEAMAQGRPVISTYIAGIPELVLPGETGWLIPAGDVDNLVEALREALATPQSVRDRMGEKARCRVKLRHSIETEAAKLRLLFAS